MDTAHPHRQSRKRRQGSCYECEKIIAFHRFSDAGDNRPRAHPLTRSQKSHTRNNVVRQARRTLSFGIVDVPGTALRSSATPLWLKLDVSIPEL